MLKGLGISGSESTRRELIAVSGYHGYYAIIKPYSSDIRNTQIKRGAHFLSMSDGRRSVETVPFSLHFHLFIEAWGSVIYESALL